MSAGEVDGAGNEGGHLVSGDAPGRLVAAVAGALRDAPPTDAVDRLGVGVGGPDVVEPATGRVRAGGVGRHRLGRGLRRRR